MRIATMTVGEAHGQPRVWLEGKYLLPAGFGPGTKLALTISKDRIVVTPGAGTLAVSRKTRKGDVVPVIDLNSSALAKAFGQAKVLEVQVASGTITLQLTRTLHKQATRCRNGAAGSLFSGAGLLDQAAKEAGYEPTFGVELDPTYAELFHVNHPTAQLFNQSIADVRLELLPPVELLTIGLPCQPFSNNRTLQAGGAAKRDRSLPPEAHDLGDLLFYALRVVDHLNPASVLFECVPGWLGSGAGWIARHALTRMGYTVDAGVFDPVDYGSLTRRRRAVLLAVSDKVVRWPAKVQAPRRLAEVLEPVRGAAWFDFRKGEKQWLKDHWDRQTAKGNGFASQVVTADSPFVGTITRRYMAGQGDNPVLAHPSRPATYRWFTLDEIRRLHDIPASYYLGEAKTRAGEVIGQGVHVGFFRQVIQSLGRAGRQLARAS